LTRIEFLEYLNIIDDVGDDIAPHWGEEKANLRNTKIDVQIFSELCDYLKKKIKFALDHQSVFSQVDYLDMIVDFNEKLDQKRDDRSFSSMKVYDTFFDNYDLFHNNPLGFVQVSHSGNGVEYTAVADPITLHHPIALHPVGTHVLPTLLTDARRCYPVINVDGNAVMVAYQRGIGTQRGQFVVASYFTEGHSQVASWEKKGEPVCIRHESSGLFLDTKTDSNNVFLHSPTNLNEDTRQWKFEKQGLGPSIWGGGAGGGTRYAIKNIATGKYLDGRDKNWVGKTGAGVVLATDRTPTSADTPPLWTVWEYNIVGHADTQFGLYSVGSECFLNGHTSPYPGLNTDVKDAGLFTMRNPSNFFQDFHKNPNDKLGLEAYISSDQRTTFVGLNYEHRHLNDHIMVGVPFLSRLPFDEIVSPLHPEDA